MRAGDLDVALPPRNGCKPATHEGRRPRGPQAAEARSRWFGNWIARSHLLMRNLVGGTHFLLLRGGCEPNQQLVFCFSRFDDILPKWEGVSRLSPIFATERAPAPEFVKDAPSWLIFFGPKFPGLVEFDSAPHVYLSLGVLNVVVFCTTQDQRQEVRASVESSELAWEEWSLVGNSVSRVTFGAKSVGTAAHVAGLSDPFKAKSPALLPTARECQVLLVATAARSPLTGLNPSYLQQFGNVLQRLLSSPNTTLVEKLQILVNTNAALSAQLWQACAGTPPILETPCQFATHSLLGIGTASMALQALTRYVERAFEDARITERIARLTAQPREPRALLEIGGADAFWHEDHLYDSVKIELSPVADPPAPHVSYFSGREGYRSNLITLSAPAEVIHSCNTSSWTLHTLTHELSHSVVRSTMGQLLPDPSDAEDIARILRYLNDPEAAPSLHEQLREFLTFAVWAVSDTEFTEGVTPEKLADRLRQNWASADEILTHVFDFLYHYQGDPEPYVRSIWASWAQIPHIELRLSDYIDRTLCALHALDLRRDKAKDVTLDVLADCLEKVKEAFPDALYIPDAIESLSKERNAYKTRLDGLVPLVKFVKGFLFSPVIAAILSSPGEHAPKTSGAFTEERIANPLRFVAEWSQDAEPQAIRSVWMLQYLAYGRVP